MLMQWRSTLLKACLIGPGLVSGFCGSRLSHFHKRQDSKVIEEPAFGYAGRNGPVNWHLLDSEFATCSTGTTRSPINVDTAIIARLEPWMVNLDIPIGRDVLFENLGTTVEVVKNGSLTLSDDTGAFQLAQFHFHSPSEHVLDLEHFNAEMHMVHEAEDGSIAVVAFLINVSSRHGANFLEDALADVVQIFNFGESTTITELDMASFARKASQGRFFTYNGSLTTPPCTEGVTWYISETPLELDPRTFRNLRSVVKTNNRFVQNTLGDANLLRLAQKGAQEDAGEEITAVVHAEEEVVEGGVVEGAIVATEVVVGEADEQEVVAQEATHDLGAKVVANDTVSGDYMKEILLELGIRSGS